MTTDPTATPAVDHELEQARHASWAELFFDLVVVAGLGLLAHVLVADLSWEALGLYTVLFLAFWLCWTAFMLYGNVAAGNTHVIRLLIGMVGLGVMVAAVPGIAHNLLEEGHDAHVFNAFAVAYVATRVYGAQSWSRGQVLLDFPVAQHTVGVLPWIVSLWVDEPWKLVLWAVGLALDLFLVMVVSGDDMLERYEERVASVKDRMDKDDARGRTRRGPGGGRRPAEQEMTITGVSVDGHHLAERLGLFVIIVLGEGVIQVVHAASESEFEKGLLAAGLASFALLAGMFGLSVVYGYAGLPHVKPGTVGTRVALALHGLVAGVVAALTVALAHVVEHPHDALPDEQRWLLCGAVAAYFALGFVGSLLSRGFRPLESTVGLVSGVGVPVVLGLVADDVRGTVLVVYVVLVVLAHLLVERRDERAAAG